MMTKLIIIIYQLWFWQQPHTNIISYSLFADADMGIHPHAASQYHSPSKVERGIAMRQISGNEFISCWNDVCHIIKHFHSFKIPAIPLISLKHSKTTVLLSRIEAARKWRRSWSPLWRSFLFISHINDVKLHGC